MHMGVYSFNLLCTYSVLPAALVAIYRYKFILKSYRPFCYFLWLGLANELISTILAVNQLDSHINDNLYVLAEFFIILWFFKSRTLYQRNHRLFTAISIVTLGVWMLDNFAWHSLRNVNALYRAWYSFILIYFSVDQINYVLATERRNIGRHPMFIICTSFLVYYSYKCFYEIFYLADLSFSRVFNQNLFLIYLIINLVSNSLYCIASLWIPTKQKFIIPY